VCKTLDGQSCSTGGDCQSGVCADGVCCATPCTAACTSCALPSSKGTCTGVPAGAPDPRGQCVASRDKPCGLDGKCTAGGACELFPPGTACGDSSCNGDALATQECDGAGGCKTISTSCGAYTCIKSAWGGAMCASGPCASAPSLMTCLIAPICATNCKCLMTQLCTGSACACP
jgi:hypothetical protein